MNKFLWPLIGFFILIALLALGLRQDPRELPSPLVGKPAPAFSLSRLDAPTQNFSPQDMRGRVWLLNVWATWCVSCRAEHPVLLTLAQNKTLPIVGLNYKELRGDGDIDMSKVDPKAEKQQAIERAQSWLTTHGNPYTQVALDLDGRVGIDYGVYGVPETYLIDQAGVVRLKHIGPLTPEVISAKILPLAETLVKESTR